MSHTGICYIVVCRQCTRIIRQCGCSHPARLHNIAGTCAPCERKIKEHEAIQAKTDAMEERFAIRKQREAPSDLS